MELMSLPPIPGSPASLGVDSGATALLPAAATDNSVLRRRIGDEICTLGPITFRRFMALALYHPQEGYYRRRPAHGARGDYLTSAELHPLFGALLRRQLRELWTLLGEPPTFSVMEMGAGSGALARAILAAGPSDAFAAALRYEIVEPAPQLRGAQTATLGALAGSVVWHEALDGLTPRPFVCLLSNELPDSFPVHRVTVKDGELRELFVAERDGQFVETPGAPSTSALANYFARLGLLPGEGCTAEVNLDALRWIGNVARVIERGFALTLDYGYSAARLYAPWRRQGTLLCYSQHSVGDDPYVRVGRQDLTSHVDFTSLVRAGEEAGLHLLGFTTQQRFLSALGITEALAGGPAGAGGLEEYLARRRAVADLTNPEGLGRIRVLLQSRGVPATPPRGFAGADDEAL